MKQKESSKSCSTWLLSVPHPAGNRLLPFLFIIQEEGTKTIAFVLLMKKPNCFQKVLGNIRQSIHRRPIAIHTKRKKSGTRPAGEGALQLCNTSPQKAAHIQKKKTSLPWMALIWAQEDPCLGPALQLRWQVGSTAANNVPVLPGHTPSPAAPSPVQALT